MNPDKKSAPGAAATASEGEQNNSPNSKGFQRMILTPTTATHPGDNVASCVLCHRLTDRKATDALCADCDYCARYGHIEPTDRRLGLVCPRCKQPAGHVTLPLSVVTALIDCLIEAVAVAETQGRQ